GIGWDPQAGELWFAGEAAEALLLELEARRRELVAELESRVEPPPPDYSRVRALAQAAIQGLSVDMSRFDKLLSAGTETSRAAELGAELRRLGAQEVELRRAASEAAENLSAVDVELARTDAERAEAQRRLDASGVEPSDEELGRDELAEKLERLER